MGLRPDRHICNECVDLCTEVMRQKPPPRPGPDAARVGPGGAG
ncbi:MAG: hypothetical protein E6I08_05490 [Chloroflexi bacterium]|nr:MAG: hypothetical protein E6I08_05490 [Chloroflexota bacterium]